MIKDLIGWLRAWWKMPIFKFEWTYCVSWYWYRSQLQWKGEEFRDSHVKYPIEGMFMFNPYETILRDRKALIPAFRTGEYVGYYKVMRVYYKYHQGEHSDWAGWDDGLYADLRLVKVAKET